MNRLQKLLLTRAGYVFAVVLHFIFCRWGGGNFCSRNSVLTLPWGEARRGWVWEGHEFVVATRQNVTVGLFTAPYIDSPLVAAIFGIITPLVVIVAIWSRSLSRAGYVFAVVLHFIFCRWGGSNFCSGNSVLTLPWGEARRDSVWEGHEFDVTVGLFTAPYIDSPLVATIFGIITPLVVIVAIWFMSLSRKAAKS